ncbi:MAG: hypothetical protein A2Y02_01080 [Omnitrophica bacterium GWA2_52_12]|nr:MAG: hypothetical protein A2Y02_01080 [Omnitrophica bacterium GWA2_52_12]
MEFFAHLHNLEDLIRWGGYIGLFIIVFAETGLFFGFFLPGDSLLVTAGLIAALDHTLDIRILTGLLCAAAILGDSTGYAIGYHFGPRIFNKEDSIFFHRNHLLKAQRFYEKYGAKTIVLARFVPIVRTFAPTVAGIGKMHYAKFVFYNIAGGIAWVGSMCLSGYYLGRLIPGIDKKIHWVIIVVILLSLVPLFLEWRKARKEKKEGSHA